ncbi:MAG: hypothetical protein DCC56_13220 [Anaerolineae bacterium]|nr:MAG: hypothetical protein DCC56_13220 [Anaerolineae bacterium]WKZ42853.1 MAG: glycosyltransferase family 4 protein [Anaerolineales bacterium]
MTKILSVATAGLLANQLKDNVHKQFPRVDYVELQSLLNTKVIDYSEYDATIAGHLFRRIEREIRSDVYLTYISWLKSREYSTVFTWSERAGIPFAGLKRFFPSDLRFVTMFQCWSERQETLLSKLNLFSAMDSIIVHCASMKENLIRLNVPAGKIQVIHFSIDQNFFAPQPYVKQETDLIASVGETRSRNYNSLFQAAAGLPAKIEIAGYGYWYAREKNDSIKSKIPNNVIAAKRLSYDELRNLYARASFVVLPLEDLVYSAGATSTLEAGSMGRAVIAFRSKGITEYIVDGETGILVEPGNVAGLRDAISYLLANPAEAERLGANARRRINERFRLETYVQNIANVLQQPG